MTTLYQAHIHLDLSNKRNVYVVGDIHGEFDKLSKALERLSFDPLQDVVISVGDLVDRGPDSMAALRWIKEPWFYRVLGNHELFIRAFLTRQVSEDRVVGWGGGWFVGLPTDELRSLISVLEDAPYAMTLLTPKGYRVGIAHADCVKDWDRQISTINQTWTKDFTTQSRVSIDGLRAAHNSGHPLDTEAVRVANIDHVFHGHTILGRPFTAANRTWIDTGAYAGGDLTVLNIDEFLSG